MKVVVKLRKPDNTWEKYTEKLKEYADVAVIYDGAPMTLCDDAAVLITTKVSKEELQYFPKLKKIFLFKTGMDGLPLEELRKRDISVVCSHANADVIAQHALALALALIHRIPEFHSDLSRGFWYSDGENYYRRSISSFCIGIFGFGSIGKSLYSKLLPMNKNILVLNKSGNYPDNVMAADSFDELTEKCDLLFICVPKTDETINAFDKDVLRRMKNAFIVNISRAEICNEKALFEALSDGYIAGYASDVWYNKADKTDKLKAVMPSKYPFEKLKNVVMSPHCATHDKDSHERYISDAVSSCIMYLRNEETD